MNAQLKTVLLTILTLSCFVIALVELSGVSKTAIFNKYDIGGSNSGMSSAAAALNDPNSVDARTKRMHDMPKTTIQFDTTKFSFGEIKEGAVVKHAFHFKNTGTNPLLISNAVTSCGCTVPSYPKEPVPPGGEGDIVLQFNSKGKHGMQHKNVLIYSNAQEEAMSMGFDADVKDADSK